MGQLNVPKWPEITGVDSFSGKKMHSARWDWSYDVTDKKVAMLGNGKYSRYGLKECANAEVGCTSAQIVRLLVYDLQPARNANIGSGTGNC